MKLLKIVFWVVLGVFLVSIVYKWYRCRQKGEASGKPFTCSLFSSEPTWLVALEQYNSMMRGKCYEVVDYGKSMSYRQVQLEECGEMEPSQRSESLAEFEIVEEYK